MKFNKNNILLILKGSVYAMNKLKVELTLEFNKDIKDKEYIIEKVREAIEYDINTVDILPDEEDILVTNISIKELD